MDSHSTSDSENLRRLVAVADKIHTLLSNQHSSHPSKGDNTHAICDTIPPIILTLPDDITQSLIDVGCPPIAARPLSHAFVQSAHRIRAMYEALYRQTCEKLASRLASDPAGRSSMLRFGPIIERRYRDQIRATEKLAINRGRILSQRECATQPSRSKPIFNSEFVPFLEKYFEHNAYPSAADRAVLARKSMMSPRQIEVWFQNHRNRAKKEGKVLKKNSIDLLPYNISIESFKKTMPFFVIPEKERKEHLNRCTSDQVDDDSDKPHSIVTQDGDDLPSTFILSTPPHAFPTPYPPRCNYDPFPINTGTYTFPAPVWFRKPATSLPVRPPINFEDFIVDFSVKLILREPPSRKQQKPITKAPFTPWFAATHTVAPPAPHPAFVRSSTPATQPLPTPLPTIPAPPSRLRPFQSPSLYSPLATLVPPQQNDTPVRRKVARLPRRTPKSSSIAHRRASPAMSEGSPAPSSRSLSSSSRTSSFGSSSPSDRRPSSSSSSSSSSSTLTTPVLSTATLPESSPIIAGLDDLFGDASNTLSPIEGLPFGLPGATQKESFSFNFEVPCASHT